MRSFIGNILHPVIRCYEDTFFKRELLAKEGYNETQVNKLLYYYFEPRTDSVTWLEKKQRNEEDYQQDEKYWIKKRKPEWYEEHQDEL